jgi:flagellar hook-associated protein 1
VSSFIGLHTALSGIRAGQIGLDTAGHNVANANTPGYTRQRVDLATRRPWQSPVGTIGTGVDVNGVERMRDAFLDTRVRTVGQSFAAADTTAALLQRAEDVLGEPDNGITGPLGTVFDAFDAWAMTPADTGARLQVRSALEAMTQRFNAVSAGWDQLSGDTQVRLDTLVSHADAKLARVSELNRLIGGFGPDDQPNDLLDERDLLLDQLASEIGATSSTGSDGMVDVVVGGQTVVSGGAPAASLTYSAPNVQIGSPPTAVTVGGELGALVSFLHDTTRGMPALRADFDQLARDIATSLNAAHDGGVNLDGESGAATIVDLVEFSDGPPGTAAGMQVPAALTPRKLAGGATAAAHDGDNAALLAALREGAIDEAARGFAVGLGQKVATATAAADAQESLYVGATVSRQSAHSVSLDEEMVSLVQYQRALEASARVMTTVDEALDTLINRTGVVGR